MRGQITFTVGAETIVAGPGDRVDFEPGERHAARVGPQGATYIAGTAR
jgi:quercetin dioxygenase-like cupin family protein